MAFLTFDPHKHGTRSRVEDAGRHTWETRIVHEGAALRPLLTGDEQGLGVAGPPRRSSRSAGTDRELANRKV
jgi:hypothetical protein